MRILLAGTPAIAVPLLRLIGERAEAEGHELVAVLTKADSPKGRHGTPTPSEVGAAAAEVNAAREAAGKVPFPVLKFEKLDSAARETVAALNPELLVSIAYGKIFGPKFLDLFPRGGINMHPSLLPRYRGAAPIPFAILNRDSETGISIQRLALEMDKGDILVQERVPLSGRETTEGLTAFAAERGAELTWQAIQLLASGQERPMPQNEAEASYCRLLAKEDGLLDWSLPAVELDARIRAFLPWPQAFTTHNGQKVYILEAHPVPVRADTHVPAGTVVGMDKGEGILVATGAGLLALERLQYEHKKPLDWRSFLNGARGFIGSSLGS